METLFYFLICIAATTLGGISGVGGGVIIKPVLDALSDMPVAVISFLSGCTVLAMTVSSMLFGRGGPVRVEKRRGTPLAIGAAAGGIAGKELFELAKGSGGQTVTVLQQSLMIALTLGVLVYTLNRRRIRGKNVQRPSACAGIGLALGLLSSFLGIGGGPINLAVLYYFFSMDTKTAAVNSLYIILFSQAASLIKTLLTGSLPPFQWPVLLVMASGGILGGILGRKLGSRMETRQIDTLFLGLLAAITGISVYNLVRAIVP